jgi:hypothetical protein
MSLPFALEGRTYAIGASPDIRQTAAAGPRGLEGVLDVVDCSRIQGWALDGGNPQTAVLVDIHANGRSILVVEASKSRPDLVTAGKGTGRHAFAVDTPASLRNGTRYEIEAKVSTTDFALTGSPQSLVCPP